MQSLFQFLVLFIDVLFDLPELLELFDGLIGYLGFFVDLPVVGHLVHVVGGDGPDYVLVLFVVPGLFVLVEDSLVKLVEEGKGSRLVVLLLLLVLLLLVDSSDQDDGLLVCGLLLEFLWLDVDFIGVASEFLVILWSLGFLAEEVLEFDGCSEEGDVLASPLFETSH